MIDDVSYLLGQSINMIVQIILFGIIPFIWYIISKRKWKGFFSYIGLKKSNKQSYIQAFKITSLAYIFSFIIIVILKFMEGGISTNYLAKFYNCEVITFILILIIYGVQTGISEEILFRGFFGKRLISRYSFLKGNILQSLIFTVPHIVTFGKAPTLEIILGIINSAVIGFVFGYIMDKKSDGSIIPIIVCHGVINIVSSIMINVI